MKVDDVVKTTTDFFLKSHDYNGMPLCDIAERVGSETKARNLIKQAVEKGRVNCAFSSVSLNPHIKRCPDLEKSLQLELLDNEECRGICCYPSPGEVAKIIDLETLKDRPFHKELLEGHSQLSFVAFDLGVLERYSNDPRYLFRFPDYRGQLYLKTEHDDLVEEGDSAFLESFGLGYDEDGNRYVVAFRRYLTRLSSRHQQHWNSFRVDQNNILLEEQYYRASILGEFTTHISFFGAILKEMELINGYCEDVYGIRLFRKIYDKDRPKDFTLFVRSTQENFDRFIHTLDKMLSDNLYNKFFRGKVDLKTEEERDDGKVVEKDKASITLLEEWIRQDIHCDDEEAAIEVIISPFRDVRSRRQKPAHQIVTDEFSPAVEEEQKKVLKNVYMSLSQLRYTLAKHPQATKREVPRSLEEGRIAYY